MWQKKNNKYNIKDKEKIIMNPIKENGKNKRKNEDKNFFQKLIEIDSKKRKKEIEEKKDENNKINEESDIIEEESKNDGNKNNNNNKIENEENSEIKNEIEEESKTYRKLENIPILTAI